MNKQDLNLVTFPASKNYPVEDREFTKEVTAQFSIIEHKLELVRQQLELLDITQERIRFYLDEIDNFIP
ncbi:MAG: hypothetical protein E2O68_04010 [Deltaproteobacteria bacterium]|nr:MAG: hypothetical protein E2O68_04010 [Deltaproteobacteria bacterium]